MKISFKRIKLKYSSIQYRILIPYLVLILVALFSISSISLLVSEKIINEKVSMTTEKTLNQVNRQIDGLLSNMASISYLFAFDEKVLGYLNEKNYTEIQYVTQASQFDKTARNYMLPFSDINLFVTIYGLNGKIFTTYENDGTKPEELGRKILSSDWYRMMQEKHLTEMWIPLHQNIQPFPGLNNRYMVSIVRIISDVQTGETLGICMISIPEPVLQKLFTGVPISPGSEVFITDQNGNIIADKDNTMLFGNIKSMNYFDKIPGVSPGHLSQKIKGVDCLVIYDTIEKTGWKIIETVPKTVLVKDIVKLRGTIAFAVLLVVLAAFLISFYISSSITKPVRKLAKTMKEVEAGNLDVFVDIKSGDEIEILGNRLNDMMKRIKMLVDTIYTEQEEKQRILLLRKQEELDLLQAQINPHFLFNTLNSIKWMAYMSQAKHVGDMIGALGSLLEMSINKKDNLITLDEEIENLNNYISLMKMRYNNKLKIYYDIDESAHKALVPKLVLQPIAENAILHGFKDMGGVGEITISTEINNEGNIQIKVTDNGTGMDPENAKLLLAQNSVSKRRFSSIGLNNINERIILHFGREYGLSIESCVGEGTTVKVLIPLKFAVETGEMNV